MDVTSYLDWHPRLLDPTGQRKEKPRACGKTMVIDKGLGLYAFEDMLQTSGTHIDLIKIGFGTAPLYPQKLLQTKIEMAKAYEVCILPGGTFLEVAVRQNAVDTFFEMITFLGFDGLEVSDGTIEISRSLRNDLIKRGLNESLTVYTEYGKKLWGSKIEINQFVETLEEDLYHGAAMVTVEGRESGVGVGIFDEHGKCRQEQLDSILTHISDPTNVMWEAPQKSQQVDLLTMLGPDTNLGNVLPHDIMSVESLRRSLRSDTLLLSPAAPVER